MKRLAALVVLVAGCSQQEPNRQKLLGEIFANVAYEVIKAETASEAHNGECCSECKGTGKVKSGDGLSIVGCPCPDSCPCKKRGAK